MTSLFKAIESTSLVEEYSHLMSAATRKAMANIIERGVYIRRTDEDKDLLTVDVYENFNINVKREGIPKAAETIVHYLNKLSEKGYISGFLAPLCKAELILSASMGDILYGVYVFPVLTPAGTRMVKEDKPSFWTPTWI